MYFILVQELACSLNQLFDRNSAAKHSFCAAWLLHVWCVCAWAKALPLCVCSFGDTVLLQMWRSLPVTNMPVPVATASAAAWREQKTLFDFEKPIATVSYFKCSDKILDSNMRRRATVDSKPFAKSPGCYLVSCPQPGCVSGRVIA